MIDPNKFGFLAIAKGLNAFLLFAALGLLATNMILGGLLWQAVGNKSRTLVPPTTSQAFTVSDGAVDASYLQQMAEYFVYLKLNVTPNTVERKYGLLLDYVDSDAWSAIQPTLMADALSVMDENVSSTFDIEGVQVAEETMKVKLSGTLQKYVGNRPLPPEPASYIVDMDYPYGELTLLSIRKIKEDA